jgi:hypothetical protein
MRCDFCSGVPITATYYAHDFFAYSTPEVVEMSEGKWAACHECEILIDGNKWDDLVERVTETFMRAYPEMKGVPKSVIEQQFLRLYTDLRAAGFKKETR